MIFLKYGIPIIGIIACLAACVWMVQWDFKRRPKR